MHSASPGTAKRALRARMLEERGMLAPEVAAGRGEAAQGHVLASPYWASARTVALYMPIRGEVDTGLLRSRAWAEGKRVLLPRCAAGRRGELEFAACGGAAELAPGAYGIPEPLPALPAVDMEDPEQAPQMLIAPCLAVDWRGCRLGYGGGYYDRFLRRPAMRATLCIALIYAVQRVLSLPADEWDVRLHGICTEDGLTWL
ncbi:MAG: 5-formyltetrahydrofolate cyclo-ligase [Deltaproteobacteria bacterium]|jgi:5-formyltetrahydrofolate cyclo-ligase|nr:5-formyltetrahydrofolate cyclo-ligase [Deltaproteobacteria bacterium]